MGQYSKETLVVALSRTENAMIFDPMYLLFMIPGIIFSLWAQSKVKGNFQKYSQVPKKPG